MPAQVRPGAFRVAAAIDFGTHSTGYAWVPVDEHNDDSARRKINVHAGWPHQPVPGAKTLSAVLLTVDRAVQAWGYTARKQRGTATPGSYHQAFKLDLGGVRPGQPDTEHTENPLSAVEATLVAAAFLGEIVRVAVQEIEAAGYQQDDIRWCLTVPAIWDDRAISLTRQVAVRAGLPDDTERLRLVREPEAAALHCLARGAYLVNPRRAPAVGQVAGGSRYMIVDCGGGTVDISAYEVNAAGRLRQVGTLSGGTFGSEFLNRAFLTKVLARRIGGIDKVADLARSHPDVLADLADEWEKQKLTVDVTEAGGSVRVTDKLLVPLTVRVYRALEDVVPDLRQQLRKSQEDEDSIVVERAEVAEIFEGEVGKILAAVDGQLAAMGGRKGAAAAPEKILLVGGFAQSRYLQLRLSLYLGDRATVLVPPDGADAVLTGAVHFCYDSALIGARLSRYTYGFEVCMPFEEGTDPEDSRLISDYNGEALCSTRFNPVVAINESVPVDYEYNTEVCPILRDQRALRVRLFASTQPDPRYVTRSTAHGEVTVDVPAPSGPEARPEDRAVDLVFRFGGAEMTVTATERSTGRTAQETVAFERTEGEIRPNPPRVSLRRRTVPPDPCVMYDKLFDQQLMSLAREQFSGQSPDRSLQRARCIAWFSRLLFGGEPRTVHEVWDRLKIDPWHGKGMAQTIAAIVNTARKLREAKGLTWNFTLEPGAHMRGYQRPWGLCRAEDPVRFVVAPALEIGGVVYRPQRVYTSPEPPPP